jgi:hypothetical protein
MIRAESQGAVGPPTEHLKSEQARSAGAIWKVFLIFVIVGLAYSLFHLHFADWIGSLRWFAFIVTTIAATAGVVADYFPSAKEWLRSLIGRLPEQPWISPALFATVLVLLALHGSIVSVRISASGTADREIHEVALQGASGDRLCSLQLNAEQTAVQKYFFLLNVRGSVDVVLDGAVFYEVVRDRFDLLTSIRLRVPDDFPARKYYFVHIVPGSGLFEQLPDSKLKVSNPVSLRITRRNGFAARESAQLDTLTKQQVYCGAPEAVIDRFYGEDVWSAHRELLERYWYDVGAPSDAVHARLNVVHRNRLFLPTEAFGRGDTVTIEAMRLDTVMADSMVVLDGREPWRTIILEATQ